MPSANNLAQFINGYHRHLTMKKYGFHRHSCMEIVYITSGSGNIFFKNGEVIEFHANDLFIYWPNSVHGVEIYRQSEELVIRVDPIGLHTAGDSDYPIIFHDFDDDFLYSEILKLCEHSIENKNMTQKFINNLRVTALLLELLHIEPEVKEVDDQLLNLNAKLERAKYILENDFSQIQSVAEVADMLGLSYEYLRHKFRSKFSLSMKQYLMKVRIDHAKFLLANNKKTLGVIAEECGFDNERYFCTRFRKETGLTPGVYRKRSQGFGFI
ncbi:AraC family transcriptional regulator [Lentisphaerota bacterium WC36G]|nr:AraC family transcriptional regulator [Lentisphaerae bacterium WC36]